METESDVHDKNTEALITNMTSFLDVDPTESFHTDDFDASKNPLCAGIKTIIGTFPPPPTPPAFQNMNAIYREDQKPFPTKSNYMDKACRFKDPYIQEVNRLMFCSVMGHPPNDSVEYHQAAENYAIYGKNFLDFPTDIRFSKSMDVGCFGDVSLTQFLNRKSTNLPQILNNFPTQMPVMMNPLSYWANYPFYQAPNMPNPYMYSNTFLMTQWALSR